MSAESPAVPIILPALLDIQQTESFLGIGKSTVYAMIRTGEFGPSPVRLRRCVRFRRTEVDAWVAAGCPSRERWQTLKREEALR